MEEKNQIAPLQLETDALLRSLCNLSMVPASFPLSNHRQTRPVVYTPNININDMKLNKTLALAALIAGSLLAGGAIAQAQDSTTHSTNGPAAGPRPRGMMSVDFLTKRLALTDDEKTNVVAALADNRQKRRDLQEDTSLSNDDKRAQAKQLREDLNAKMKDILTPDQYTQWLKISTVHRRPAPTPPADGAPSTNAPAPVN
jgi:hypothetical protein